MQQTTAFNYFRQSQSRLFHPIWALDACGSDRGWKSLLGVSGRSSGFVVGSLETFLPT